eukprot:84350-Prymnesium_polylepis.2
MGGSTPISSNCAAADGGRASQAAKGQLKSARTQQTAGTVGRARRTRDRGRRFDVLLAGRNINVGELVRALAELLRLGLRAHHHISTRGGDRGHRRIQERDRLKSGDGEHLCARDAWISVRVEMTARV